MTLFRGQYGTLNFIFSKLIIVFHYTTQQIAHEKPCIWMKMKFHGVTKCRPYKWVLERALRAFSASCLVTYSTFANLLCPPGHLGSLKLFEWNIPSRSKRMPLQGKYWEFFNGPYNFKNYNNLLTILYL